MARKRDGTPTPLANNEPPDLPPLTFDIDDVTGHYPIGLLKEKAHSGGFSENPLEFPELFDEQPDDVVLEPELVGTPARRFTIPARKEFSPAVLLMASLLVGSIFAMLAVAVVVLAMAVLGV